MQHHSHDFEKEVSEGAGRAPKIIVGAVILTVLVLLAKMGGLF